MIKNEWRSLLKNKFMIVVMLAIIIIPTIYTTIFLGSMWDPYGEVDKLPVAIVNNDKAVVYNDKTMDVGGELVDNLKENNSLDFNFVDEEVAKNGLENGTYYMVITIPEDFSSNATTLMDEEPLKMNLDYETNPGTNYIASKMSETAVEKIKESVQEKVTQQYAETIFEQIQTLGDGLNEAADGTKTAIDGVTKLKEGNDTITTKLQTLADSSLIFRDGADELSVGLKQYTDGVITAKAGSDELAPGVKKLNDGISQYTSGVSRAKEGSSKVTGGLSLLNSGAESLSNGLGTLSNSSDSLREGVLQLSNGNKSILNALNTMSDELGKSINSDTENQLKMLQSGASSLNEGIQNFNDVLKNTDTTGLSNNITNSLSNIGARAEYAGNNYEKMVGEVKASNAFNSLNDTQKDEILKILNDNGSNIKNDLTSIGNSTKNVADNINVVNGTVNTVKENVNKLAAASNQVIPQSNKAISDLSNGLGTVKEVLDRKGSTSDSMGIIQAVSMMNYNFNVLSNGVNDYTNGVDEANTQMPTLTSNVAQLYLGSSGVTGGLGELTSKNNELVSGASRASIGAQKLNAGLGELSSKNNKLLTGASKLSDGASQISDGAGQLRDGSNTLGNGLNDLYDGTVKLNEGLSDGAEEVNSINPSDDTFEMMAAPISGNGTQMTQVDNNGNAMAPYMMCVALWVACMAFCLMYPLTSKNEKVDNGFKWWMSKASVILVVTIAQAVVMVFMLKAINGFNPAQVGKLLLVACLASVTFMAIMSFFNIVLDKVGSFIMLVFMVLQLGGCAGTYPLELSAHFYHVINPFMPFTYGVHAFRSAICGGASIKTDVIFLASLLVVFTALTIAAYEVKARKMKNEEENGNKQLETCPQ